MPEINYRMVWWCLALGFAAVAIAAYVIRHS